MRLSEFVRVDTADVHKGGALAATLQRDGSHVRFRHLDGYEGPPVATNLVEPIDDLPAGAVPPFFAGLLPEGRRLQLLQSAVKTSADDELTLLLAVGADTVGDVQVVPAGTTPTSPAPRFVADDADEVRFSDLLATSFGERIDTVALPGVQDKLSARTANVPVREGQLSDAILKLETGNFPRLVANEAACLAGARAAGLAVPEHRRLTDRDGTPALLVSRFDRVLQDGRVRALPQQDGCQTLGLWPADKYRPDAVEVVAGLAAHCTAPAVAALRLWEQVLLSWLAGNGDLHAKNLSIRQVGGRWEPTPVYDVVFTHPYGDTDTMALPVDGEPRVARLDRARFVRAAEATGVRAAAMELTIDRLLARTGDLPGRLASLDIPGTSQRKLERVLQARRDRLSPG